MTTKTKGRCLLMVLPPEIQNRIFRLVSTDTFDVRASVCPRRVKKHQVIVHNPPGLLLVNKSIYLNTVKMFYANATFQFLASYRIAVTVRRWFEGVKKNENAELVSNVKLLISGPSCQRRQARMSDHESSRVQEIVDSVEAVVGPGVRVELFIVPDPRF